MHKIFKKKCYGTACLKRAFGAFIRLYLLLLWCKFFCGGKCFSILTLVHTTSYHPHVCQLLLFLSIRTHAISNRPGRCDGGVDITDVEEGFRIVGASSSLCRERNETKGPRAIAQIFCPAWQVSWHPLRNNISYIGVNCLRIGLSKVYGFRFWSWYIRGERRAQ